MGQVRTRAGCQRVGAYLRRGRCQHTIPRISPPSPCLIACLPPSAFHSPWPPAEGYSVVSLNTGSTFPFVMLISLSVTTTLRAPDDIAHPYTSWMIIRFSTYSVSVALFFWTKMKLTNFSSYKGEHGTAKIGGTNSRTSAVDGGNSYSNHHPTWVFAFFALMARLWRKCWHIPLPSH